MAVVRGAALVLAALAGALVGFFIAASYAPFTTHTAYPLPYHTAKYPGGVSLRFAMVHDVLHERYPRHGRVYYEERDRLVSEQLKAAAAKRTGDAAPAADELTLTDDLGVGLEMLGCHDEAVALMRKKLERQQEAGLSGRDLYTTYADLGTFLVHGQMAEGFADLPRARERLREGLSFIRKSIDVKPDAHFGREEWQAAAVEYLLAALDKPELVLQYDLVGDRLDAEVDPSQGDSINDHGGWGVFGFNREAVEFMQAEAADAGEQGEDRARLRKTLRDSITKVGAEAGWKDAVSSSHPEPVPFDEPTLGIVGMWRLGGGANPYFAVTLGEIMTRVGQRYLAWSAYERAADLAPAVSKDPAVVDRFVAHCRKRQAAIEAQLPAGDTAALRPRYATELAFGRRYQEEYQACEAQRIADGASLDDPHFYDAFDAGHGPIATPVGAEDRFVAQHTELLHPLLLPTVLLTSGLFAFLVACLLRWPPGRRTALSTRAARPHNTGTGPGALSHEQGIRPPPRD